jgi:hypothetical protein
MGRRLPRVLVGIAAALTVVSGALLADDLATNIGGGGPYSFLLPIYPVCLLPGILLVIATGLLVTGTARTGLAPLLAIAGGVLSIPLAFAGFWAGAAAALIGAFLLIREVQNGARSPAVATRPAAAPWMAPVGLFLVVFVVAVLVGPQTFGASFVSTADLVNDPVAYDLQAVYVVGDGGSSLSYTVDAVPQGANCPLGYAYLLNGYSNDSGQVYWYQVGLSYDWGGGTFSSSGWAMVYEVFGPTGDSIYPSGPGAGTTDFSGPIVAGNSVVLSLSVGGSGITMAASDDATHASASEGYAQAGAQPFGGGIPPQFAGFFTGLMTECYTSGFGAPGLSSVAYSDQGASQSAGGVFVDEIDYSWGRLPYLPAVALAPEHSAWTTFLIPAPTSFRAYGLTLLYNATGFVTESSG